MQTLGQEIKKLRKELKMTQEELAGTDMTNSHISAIENDKTIPTLQKLRVIAQRLNKPLYYFESFIVDDRDVQLQEMIYRFEATVCSGQQEAARELEQEILPALSKSYDQGLKATFFSIQGAFYKSIENLHEALYVWRKALDLFEDIGFKHKVIECHYHIASAYNDIGEHTLAEDQLKRAQWLNGQEKIITTELHSKILLAQAYTYYKMGKLSAAQEVFDCLVSMQDHNKTLVDVLLQLSVIYLHRKDYETALEYSQQAAKVARENASRNEMGRALLQGTSILISTGKRQTAISLLKQAESSLTDTDAKVTAQLYRSQILIAEEEYDLAQETLDHIATFISPKPNQLLGQLYVTQGELYLALQAHDEALKSYQQAAEIFVAIDKPYLALQQHQRIAEVLFNLGQIRNAYDILKEAHAAYLGINDNTFNML